MAGEENGRGSGGGYLNVVIRSSEFLMDGYPFSRALERFRDVPFRAFRPALCHTLNGIQESFDAFRRNFHAVTAPDVVFLRYHHASLSISIFPLHSELPPTFDILSEDVSPSSVRDRCSVSSRFIVSFLRYLCRKHRDVTPSTGISTLVNSYDV